MQASLSKAVARLETLDAHTVKLGAATRAVDAEKGLLRKAIYQALEAQWRETNDGWPPNEFLFAIDLRRFRSANHSALSELHKYSLSELGTDPQAGNLIVEFQTYLPTAGAVDRAVDEALPSTEA